MQTINTLCLQPRCSPILISIIGEGGKLIFLWNVICSWNSSPRSLQPRCSPIRGHIHKGFIHTAADAILKGWAHLTFPGHSFHLTCFISLPIAYTSQSFSRICCWCLGSVLWSPSPWLTWLLECLVHCALPSLLLSLWLWWCWLWRCLSQW